MRGAVRVLTISTTRRNAAASASDAQPNLSISIPSFRALQERPSSGSCRGEDVSYVSDYVALNVPLHLRLPGRVALDEVIYKCPNCGDLLEVIHDLEALKARSAAAWIKLFDDRYLRTHWPYGSGVWGKKEWVAPHVRNENVVSMLEGGTNLLWAERYGKQLGVHELSVKQCGDSHTGSFKDLGMTVLVSTVKQMIADGEPYAPSPARRPATPRRRSPPTAPRRAVRAMVILPRGKVSTAQLVHRWRTARSSSPSTVTSTTAWRWSSGSPTRRASTSPTA